MTTRRFFNLDILVFIPNRFKHSAYGAAGKKSAAGRTMIRPARAVDRHGPAELGSDHDDRILPVVAEFLLERRQTRVQTAETARQNALAGALIRMSVPAAGIENRDSRPIGRRQESAGRPDHFCHQWGRDSRSRLVPRCG